MFRSTSSDASTSRRNPCPQRNLPGHRNCVVCEEHQPASVNRVASQISMFRPTGFLC